MTEHLKRLLGEGGMYDAASFAAVFSFGGTVALTAVAVSSWQWGHWTWIPGGVAALWLILILKALSAGHDREKITDLELDVGFVQAAWDTQQRVYNSFSENDPGHTEYYQNFRIGDDEQSRSGSREYLTPDGVTFNLNAGDPVIVAFCRGSEVIRLKRLVNLNLPSR